MTGLSVVNSASNSRVGQAVRMLAVRLQPHQVDDVDDADPQVRQRARAAGRGRGERLERRHVAGAGHHDVGLAARVAARPVPDADAARAVRDRRVHRSASASAGCLPATITLT